MILSQINNSLKYSVYLSVFIAFLTLVAFLVLWSVDLEIAGEVCVYFCLIVVFLLLTKLNNISIPIYAFLCSIFVFYLGRPAAQIFGVSTDIYNGASHWFSNEFFSEHVIRESLSMVVIFFGSFSSGVLLSCFGGESAVGACVRINIKDQYSVILNLTALFLFLLWIFLNLSDLRSGYYEKLYETFLSGGGVVLRLMQLIGFSAIAVAIINGSDRRLSEAILINLLVGIVLALLGQRGTLITTAAAYYFVVVPRIISAKKGIFLVASLFLIAYVASGIARPDIKDYTEGAGDFITGGLMEGGATLLVLISTINIGSSSFDSVSPLHLFVPWFTGIKQIFVNMGPESTNYSNLLSYLMNPSLYFSGYGVGWTVLGDFYAIFGESFMAIFFVGILFGYYLNRSLNSNQRYLFVAPIIAILPKFLFLPRASLSTIFPLYFQIIIVIVFLHAISGRNNIYRN